MKKYFLSRENVVVVAVDKENGVVILHIGSIGDNKTNGVNVVVPQHVESQARLAQVALVNFENINVVEDNLQFEYKGAKNFPNYLPAPFNKPDIAVIHGCNNLENIKIYNNLIKFNIPYVIVPHGELTNVALSKKWLKKKIAYMLLFDRFVKHALSIQCLSQIEMDETHKGKRKFIGTNGVFDNPNKKQSFNDDKCKILYLGRLEVNIKGLDRLVDAIGTIKEFCIDHNVSVDIFGPDISGRRAELQKIIDAQNVAEIIKINDPVSGEEKTNIILEHDLFIQLSRSEGMPVGILEIMNMGEPCILTNGTRLVDKLRKYEAGFYAGESVEEIAQAIKQAVKSKCDYLRMGANAIKLVKDNYLWDKVSRDNVTAYRQLLNIIAE